MITVTAHRRPDKDGASEHCTWSTWVADIPPEAKHGDQIKVIGPSGEERVVTVDRHCIAYDPT